MASHLVWPLLEWHLTRFRVAMQVKPGQDRFRLHLAGPIVPGEITEALIILEDHAAVLLAIPQTGLGLDADIRPAPFCQYVLHVGNQGFTSSAPVIAQFLLGRVAASCAKYQRTHGAC
jgi:hypothetical protein